MNRAAGWRVRVLSAGCLRQIDRDVVLMIVHRLWGCTGWEQHGIFWSSPRTGGTATLRGVRTDARGLRYLGTPGRRGSARSAGKLRGTDQLNQPRRVTTW